MSAPHVSPADKQVIARAVDRSPFVVARHPDLDRLRKLAAQGVIRIRPYMDDPPGNPARAVVERIMPI